MDSGLKPMANIGANMEHVLLALRQSEEKYRIMAENTSDVIWILDLDTEHFRFISPSVERLLGFTVEEAAKHLMSDSLSPVSLQYLSKVLPERIELFKTGVVEHYLDELEQYHISGITIWTEVSSRFLINEENRHLEVLGVTRNISERKKQEELLKKREALLNEMARLAKIGVWEFDPVTLKQTWSDEVFRIHEVDLDYDPTVNDGIGFYYSEAQTTIARAVQEAIDFGEPFDLELKLITKKGNQRWVHSIGKAIQENGKTVRVLGSIQDITAKKEATEALLAQGEQLRNINAEKDKLFSILAHDMRSPFNTFLGFTQLLAEELDDLTRDDVQKMALSMRKSALNLFSLLEDLLEWSRLQRGVLKFYPETFILSDKMVECLKPIREMASRKGVGLILDVPAETRITADPHMFNSIIRNLTSNAVKFTRKNGLVSISASNAQPDTIEFTITDNGIGMSMELQDKLFHLTENVSSKGTEGEAGTGLGLILCKEFILKHGGNIWFKSEPGRGTSFYFTMPNIN